MKDAAALLDEELAAGIVAAKQVQRRFRKERRIDQADFSAALPRFQAVVHEVITLLNDRLDDMRSPENSAPVKDLVNRSHDTVDIAVGMVNSGAEVSTQLVNSPILKRNSENLLKHCSPGEKGRPAELFGAATSNS